MRDGEPLPAFEDRALRDRYCDLILTGGVTSAIAYPAAIFALGSVYRFNSIGGSSSGAGSAALAAAAEYRRRHGSSDGFRILAQRTAVLPDLVRGKTRLAWLFQPSARHRRLFDALVPGIAKPRGKFWKIVRGLVRAYAVPGLLGAAVGYAGVWGVTADGVPQEGWATFALVMLYLSQASLGFVLAMAAFVFCDVAHVANDDYGLCTGFERSPGAPEPPLVEWLHALIQEVAGRQPDDAPLTFADLAAAPGSPRETLGDQSVAGAVSIRLQMFTANVTHGRPVLLPHDPAEPPLYFRPSEMRRLFPGSVVEHMKRHSAPHAGDERVIEPQRPVKALDYCSPPSREPAPPTPDDDKLWRLPKQELPIVVASRMSVAFPVLFTAVPLWSLDHRDREKVFRRCLFSDGGLCSNFPIHLFDSAVPAWPTFGISLYELNSEDTRPGVESGRNASAKTTDKCDKTAVKLPADAYEVEERWSDFEQARTTGDRLFGFIGALLSTTKDWNDTMLARLPGVRDRVARVGLPPGTGGLNILMNRAEIERLSCLGLEAAKQLLARFAAPSSPSGAAAGWNEHRWVRFNVLQHCLASNLTGLSWSANRAPHTLPLHKQIREAIDTPPLLRQTPDQAGSNSPREKQEESQLLPAQAAALEGVLAALMQAERALSAPTTPQPYHPFPQPELRVRPPL